MMIISNGWFSATKIAKQNPYCYIYVSQLQLVHFLLRLDRLLRKIKVLHILRTTLKDKCMTVGCMYSTAKKEKNFDCISQVLPGVALLIAHISMTMSPQLPGEKARVHGAAGRTTSITRLKITVRFRSGQLWKHDRRYRTKIWMLHEAGKKVHVLQMIKCCIVVMHGAKTTWFDTPGARAAANDYFHCRLICWLFSRLINRLFSWHVWKMLNFPELNVCIGAAQNT